MKLPSELFALLTLAVTFVVATIVLNTPIDGATGIALSGVAIPKLGPTASSSIYLMALLAATAMLHLDRNSQRHMGTGLLHFLPTQIGHPGHMHEPVVERAHANIRRNADTRFGACRVLETL